MTTTLIRYSNPFPLPSHYLLHSAMCFLNLRCRRNTRRCGNNYFHIEISRSDNCHVRSYRAENSGCYRYKSRYVQNKTRSTCAYRCEEQFPMPLRLGLWSIEDTSGQWYGLRLIRSDYVKVANDAQGEQTGPHVDRKGTPEFARRELSFLRKRVPELSTGKLVAGRTCFYTKYTRRSLRHRLDP